MKPNLWASLFLSAVALALMCLQLVNNSGQVDGWVLVLLGIASLPWFWMALESVAFPGGSIKFRELQAKQERQGEDIQALKFLVANFLTEPDYRCLRRFTEDGPLAMDNTNAPGLFQTLDRLRFYGFIKSVGDWNEAEVRANWSGDIKTLFGITDLGREYLRLRDKV